MTGAIVGLVALYCLVIYGGKYARKPGLGSVLFLVVIAALQVAAVMYFVFTLKTPNTN